MQKVIREEEEEFGVRSAAGATQLLAPTPFGVNLCPAWTSCSMHFIESRILLQNNLRISSICQPWTPVKNNFILPMRQFAERMMLPADNAA